MNHPSSLRLRIYGRTSRADASEPGAVGAPLRVSLENALSQLEQLPRMFVEPDGSFLWTGQWESASVGRAPLPSTPPVSDQRAASGARAWQLEGTIYDDGRVVRYIDLRGDCPLSAWRSFLRALEETPGTITLQLVEENRLVPGEWLEQRLASED